MIFEFLGFLAGGQSNLDVLLTLIPVFGFFVVLEGLKPFEFLLMRTLLVY